MSVPPSSVPSAEPPSSVQQDVSPVEILYVPLPNPIHSLPENRVTVTAQENSRLPCRRCLLEASPGEILHLLAYDPFPPESVTPYRGEGPIFVHAHACEAFEGEKLPAGQLARVMSLRAYDEKDMMVDAEVVEGKDLERVAGGMLADGKARYVNVHNAKPGCFAVRVEWRGQRG